MDSSLIKTIAGYKILLGAIMVFSFSACSKESPPECEEWEIVDERANIGGCIDFSCSGSRTLQLIFCGSSLKDAKAGNTIVTSQDQCCLKTRTFKRFIRKV